ncbi:tetratricopeptide repeat protein [Microlunatus endophyticus]|uniref:tetratricopeptide repeat protein n=1 Tax=Microlunatus endophyticus TaxID=1716077 RepID=UPI001664921E|nr:tetratricopeptide repeat protein [Microlunatus endophyticus]
MSDYFDLGDYSRQVSTGSAEAQAWFDRGLIWTYAFNHEEAAVCFRKALEADPELAIAWWGLAYALGPNYNKPWEAFDADELGSTVDQVFAATSRAAELPGAGDVEAALIGAIHARYPAADPADDLGVWNADYAEAMGQVYDRFPDDLDVAALYADALMNLTPWALWDVFTGEPAPGAGTLRAKQVLDRALASPGGRKHPGLLHFFIHLMEMSGSPEAALPIADDLRGLVPDGGHLEHMPTHLDVLVGDYRRVITSNDTAIRADARYVERAGAMNFYTLYRCHNLHFRLYGALFLGASGVAFETADLIDRAVPEELLRVQSPPMADWLESFVAMRVHVLVRFGRWAEVLQLPLPDDQQLYCTTTAMLHYARGLAFAITDDHDRAATERRLFEEVAARVPQSRTLFNNTCQDILAVAGSMLDGELAYRSGNVEEGFAALRRAVELDDNLPYDEPWGWMQPTRHAYGALLLEQGRLEEAEAVYRADLGLDPTVPRSQHHPNNVWSLHGYHECLMRLGKADSAAIIDQQLTLALAHADVPIESSCFCRLDVSDHRCH